MTMCGDEISRAPLAAGAEDHDDATGVEELVSVLMPVYNAGALLRAAVESVLGQTYRNLELLVVDDGSTDGCVDTLKTLDDPRLRILRQPNAGKPAALNHALTRMRGEFYALQDADDLSHPMRIERQVHALHAHRDVAGVFCGYQLLLDGRPTAPHFRAKDPDQCRRDIQAYRMPGHDPTAMYRRSLVAEFTYDESLPVVEGYDYVLRVGETRLLLVLGECLYGYRIHDTSITRGDPARRLEMLRRAMDKARSRRGDPKPPPVLPACSGNRLHDNDLVSEFMSSVADLRYAGRHGEALRCAVPCWRRHPLDPYYWKPLLAALLPFPLYARLRRDLAPVVLQGSHQVGWFAPDTGSLPESPERPAGR